MLRLDEAIRSGSVKATSMSVFHLQQGITDKNVPQLLVAM
jgi:hypothetical protein